MQVDAVKLVLTEAARPALCDPVAPPLCGFVRGLAEGIITSPEGEAGDLRGLKSASLASLHLANSQEAAGALGSGGSRALWLRCGGEALVLDACFSPSCLAWPQALLIPALFFIGLPPVKQTKSFLHPAGCWPASSSGKGSVSLHVVPVLALILSGILL